MCGIAGFVGSEMNGGDSGQVLNRMLSRIRHRGPDEAGIYLSAGASMGTVRLSIIDLSTGQQPLSDDTGNFWISLNGEIFNYKELRLDLEKRGCKFRTTSDTEVLLLAYREYGADCLEMLNGQFAFAIWDVKNQSLFMARDRLGIRPLFYTIHNNRLVFASEIKAIFEFPGLERSLDTEALEQVFTFWTTLTPRTAFSDVHELSPGHYLTWKKGHVSLKKYWDINYNPSGEAFSGAFNEAGEQLESLLSKAVNLRLRADVPVGSYLSGGLDSSVIASLIRDHRPDNSLQTFSIGFSDSEFDESGYQLQMVQRLGTKHHHTICSSTDISTWFPQAVWHAEMPLLRTAPVPMMLLSKLVNDNGIKVVMTGEGADEMLGGYNIFKEMMVRRFWARQPGSRLRPLLLSRLYPYLGNLQSMNPAALKLFFGYRLQNTDSPLYSHLLRWNNTSKIGKLLNEDLNAHLSGEDPVAKLEQELAPVLKNFSHLAKAQYLETRVFMSGYLLSSQGDRMAMANSVEGRYPFLDHHVVEFCNSLPDAYKLSGLKEKVLLKHQFKNRLPNDIVQRAKQAYRAPLAMPFLQVLSTDYYRQLLSETNIKKSGIFNAASVSSLFKRLQSGNKYSEVDQMAVVAVISTLILHQKFISETTPLSPSETLQSMVRNATAGLKV